MSAARESEAQALWNLAVAHHREGRLPEAIGLYDQVIAYAPGLQLAHLKRGLAFSALSRPVEALGAFDQALMLDPSLIDALLGRMAALLALGRPVEAALAAESIVAIRPDLDRGRYGLGLALSAQGRFQDAVAAFDAAIALSPGWVDAQLHRGGALYGLGRLEAALEAYDRVLALAPGLEQAHYNRGKTLADLGRHQEALAAFDHAIALRPDNPDSHLNRGAMLHSLGDWSGAVRAYQDVIALEPNHIQAHDNMGLSHLVLGDWPAAAQAYRRVVALDPDHAQAHFNLGEAELALGNLRTGFGLYEWRKRTSAPVGVKRFSQPEWLGKGSIAGQRLLVHAEQGLGDTLHFCRYLDLVEAAGAQPVLMCPASLKALLSLAFPKLEIVGEDEPPPAFDRHAALMSLPAAFGTELDSIPRRLPYLRAEPARVEHWREKIGREGFKIGVAWHCSPVGAAIGRSFPLAWLEPIAALPGVRLISLQKGPGSEQVLTTAVKIETLGENFDAGP
ncbi:MAG: repeat-containing protein, partial [Caulobacteraceae bacterium]|nr:repeat-containing protein [Caulobacteraceae bacterium]